MNILRPISKAAVIASSSLKRGWIIMPLSIAMYVGVIALSALVSRLNLGMVSGIIMGIAMLVALVQFYTWCWQLIQGQTVRWRSCWGLNDHIFSNIAFVGFIMWIVFSLFGPIAQSTQIPFALFAKLGAAFLFNPIAEVAILGMAAQGGLFTEAFRISKEHLIIWFLPIVLLIVLSALAGGVMPEPKDVVMNFAVSFDVMFPAGYLVSITTSLINTLFAPSSEWLGILLAAPLACWFTLFRIALLEQLER